MNRSILCTALLYSLLLSPCQIHAIEQVSSDRIEQHKKQIESCVVNTRVARLVAAAGLLGAGLCLLGTPMSDASEAPLTGQENACVRWLIRDKLSNEVVSSLQDNMSWSSWGLLRIKSILSSGFSLLSFATLNVIGGEVMPYLYSGISSLLRYPGPAVYFYTIHARVPEILKEYTHYGTILSKKHLYNPEDTDYAALYFLNEYDEVIYRIEKFLAYMQYCGERNEEIQEDVQLLVNRLIFKTNQLAHLLYFCGLGNDSVNLLGQVKAFETEITTAIRLSEKYF